MSHFTKVKTVVRDKAVLCETLRRLHYEFREGERIPIRGYHGQNAYGQVVVDTGSKYDVGFQRQEDESYSVCADWWGVEGKTAIRQTSFLQALNQNYNHLAIQKQAVKLGCIIESDAVNEKGEIVMVVCEPV